MGARSGCSLSWGKGVRVEGVPQGVVQKLFFWPVRSGDCPKDWREKPTDRMSAVRATMGWRGAQENFGQKCLPDRWRWHFPGLFTAYKFEKH